MTPGERFTALIVTLLTGGSFVLGGIGFIVRLLWNIKGAWDKTNGELHALVDDVKDIVAHKEKDHDEFKERLTYLERRELAERRRQDT